MNAIIKWFFIWWLRSGRYDWSKLRRRLFERRYLKRELPKANSLEEIEEYLKQVDWTKDGPLHLFDCISYPQTTWTTKKDDCDGFSVLAAELLNQWNASCNPVLITALLRPVQKSHTVCAFTSPGGGLWFFDNAFLSQEEYKTYKDIVLRISENTQRLVCWDVRNPESLDTLEFHKD